MGISTQSGSDAWRVVAEAARIPIVPGGASDGGSGC
jgi:hypothetical protein